MPCQCSTISDEPVILLDLLLTMHTLWVEKKPLLSLLSIESLSGEEGSGDQQVMPELLNKEFSAKATWQNLWKHHKEPYETLFRRKNEVGSRLHGNGQPMSIVTLLCMRRGLPIEQTEVIDCFRYSKCTRGG